MVMAVPVLAGAAGAADAVDVVVGVMRHVEIEDVAHFRNVEPAGGDIGRDQQLGLALAEGLERGGARRLVHVAMQRHRVELVAHQRAVQLRDFALAVAEDDGVLEAVGRADQPAQASRAFRPDRGRSVTSNCVMVAAAVAGLETSTRTGLCRKVSAMRWISGGMVAVKNSVWRVNGTSLPMRSMSGMKPMSSMRSASSMISSSTPDKQQPPALGMVEQAAGRGDQHVDAAQQLGVLVVERDAADDQRDVELVVLAVFLEMFGDLRGEFARRLEDERARHARAGAALFEHGEHRQHEGGGLAGAGLRDAEHVAPGENVRDGLLLDGGGGLVAGRFNGGENLVGKAEMRKRHVTSSRIARSPRRTCKHTGCFARGKDGRIFCVDRMAGT